jgi:hypothetical protein
MIKLKICQSVQFFGIYRIALSDFHSWKNVKRRKRMKKAKNEVFEIQMISICMKKWMSWGAALFYITMKFCGLNDRIKS